LTEKCLGKYLKKLIGRTDIEDALKRLEKLTNEEVRMATAQVLKAAHTVDDRVGVVENVVLDVDNKVAGVDDHVKAIDDKVAVVIDGAQPSLISQQEIYLILMCLEGKETRVVIQQLADDMDQVKS
jgi:anion-transporting  ArsA/GET3 family ATPase